jgi:hypothetical protein
LDSMFYRPSTRPGFSRVIVSRQYLVGPLG